VRIDGKDVGTTPLMKLPVGVGTHHLTLQNPHASAVLERTIHVTPGETQLVNVDLPTTAAR
jgi:hypothetical protein